MSLLLPQTAAGRCAHHELLCSLHNLLSEHSAEKRLSPLVADMFASSSQTGSKSEPGTHLPELVERLLLCTQSALPSSTELAEKSDMPAVHSQRPAAANLPTAHVVHQARDAQSPCEGQQEQRPELLRSAAMLPPLISAVQDAVSAELNARSSALASADCKGQSTDVAINEQDWLLWTSLPFGPGHDVQYEATDGPGTRASVLLSASGIVIAEHSTPESGGSGAGSLAGAFCRSCLQDDTMKHVLQGNGACIAPLMYALCWRCAAVCQLPLAAAKQVRFKCWPQVLNMDL
jgi:hypothetical protein